MISFKKFYDAEPEGAASGGEAGQSPVNIAALMATKGVLNTTENKVAEPINIQAEGKQDPPPPETIVATTKVDDNGGNESGKPQATEGKGKSENEPIATSAAAEAPKWQEVLKQQEPKQVLKELGFDEQKAAFVEAIKEVDPKMVAFLNHWQNGGDVKAYLKEMATDFSTMPSEEVMRHQLRLEYPKATEAQLEVLYKKEVINAYNLDSDDDDEVAEGRLLLDAKADKYRDTFAEKQKELLFPKPPEKNNEAELAQQKLEQEQLQKFEQYKQQVNESPVTKSVVNDKVLTIGEGDEAFKYPISNPSDLTDLLFDGDKWTQKFFNVSKGANGEDVFTPDIELQMLVAAIVNDRKKFLNDIAQHYKAIGGQTVLKPLDNAKPVGQQSPQRSQAQDTSPAAAMAKQGRIVSGGVNS